MGVLWVTGLGPGGLDKLTIESMRMIKEADKVILRTQTHPAADELRAIGVEYESCDRFYASGDNFREVYEAIAEYVFCQAMKSESLCYCVPGHPLVAEETVRLLKEKHRDNLRSGAGDLTMKILPSLSFLDSAYIALGVDPIEERVMILDAAVLSESGKGALLPLPDASCMFAQVYNALIAGDLKLALLEEASPDAEVRILYHTGIPDEEELICCPLAELDHFKRFDHLTSVYLPFTSLFSNRYTKSGRLEPSQNGIYSLDSLVSVMDTLLGPEGCPWDKKQTHESLKPYLIEEANEVIEAIDNGDMSNLKEELGDVLLQVAFHSALADARGDFDITDVIEGITDKMIRRHPHVFGGEKADNPEEVLLLWEKIKSQENKK